MMFFWRVDGVFFFDGGFSAVATVGGEGRDPSFAATTVVAPMAGRGGGGTTRPSIRGTSTTGRNARRASQREAGRSDTPQRADFLVGDSAPRAGVACRMAGLFWDAAASRYDRRRPRKGEEAGPGGTALIEESARSDGRGDGARWRGSGGEGGGGGMVMAMLLGNRVARLE